MHFDTINNVIERTMLYQALTGNYIPTGQPLQAEVIIAPAFGRDPDNLGVTNCAIAEFAVDAAERYSLRIVSQFAVTNAIREMGRMDLVQQSIDPVKKGDWDYMTGDYVLRRMDSVVGHHALVVGFAYHVPRFAAQARKMGIHPILPEGLPRDQWDPKNVPQEAHCNSRSDWVRREPRAILHHKLKGWI